MDPNPVPPAGAPAPAPAQKKMSGCVLALLVVGGLLALTCLIGGAFMYRAANSETGKKLFSVMGKGIEMAEKGMNAPGAKELREAGCPQAMVLDMSTMADMLGEFMDAGEAKEQLTGVMAICQGNAFADLPDCDKLAGVYVSATHPSNPFTVTVKTQGNSKAKCTRKYAADGKQLETVE